MSVERGEGFIYYSDVRPLLSTPIMTCDGQINRQTQTGRKIKGTYRDSPRKP